MNQIIHVWKVQQLKVAALETILQTLLIITVLHYALMNIFPMMLRNIVCKHVHQVSSLINLIENANRIALNPLILML